MQNDKNYLFETERPGKALMVMALPTIASQMIVLIYNLADTWFIGRTDDVGDVCQYATEEHKHFHACGYYGLYLWMSESRMYMR